MLTHLVIRVLKELSLPEDFPVLPDQPECVAYVPCFEGGPVDCQYVFSESIELGPPPHTHTLMAKVLNLVFCLTLPIIGDEMYLCIKPFEEDQVISANIKEMVRKIKIEIRTISSRL